MAWQISFLHATELFLNSSQWIKIALNYVYFNLTLIVTMIRILY